MKDWFDLSEKDRKEIFNQVSAQKGLPVQAVEKDWWVSTALRVVFSLPVKDHLVFKGGTSLSKAWNLIERFSEDIDLALDRKFLGFDGELSNTQITNLRKASCEYINGDFKKDIDKELINLGITGISTMVQGFKNSDTDPIVIKLEYKSLFEESLYLKPGVLIEIGSRSLIEPNEEREIQSMVGIQFPDNDFADKPVLIPTVLPKKTFLEKIFLLHEEFQKSTEKVRVERMSRHHYDLNKLMNTEHGVGAIQDVELYKTIITHREKYNSIKNIDYANHHPAKINLIPPDLIIKQWEKDYNNMRESMIYSSETPKFEELINNMRELTNQLKKINF